MYAKVINGVIEKYPYSIGELRKENPQTSFPKNPSDALLADWNVFAVKRSAIPEYDSLTQTTQELTPVQVDGAWAQKFVVENKPKDQAEANVRNKRDRLLSETDWLVVKAFETNTNIPAVWEIYRQALRDIPAQPGFPWNITWPVKP